MIRFVSRVLHAGLTSRSAILVGSCIVSQSLWATPPSAVDDSRTMASDSRLTINVMANDFDSDGDAIRLVSVGSPDNGSTTANADGSVRYIPNSGFIGSDTFTYVIEDDAEPATRSTATVTVTVVDSSVTPLADGDNDRKVAQAFESACGSLNSQTDDEISAGGSLLLARCEGLSQLGINNPELVAEALNKIAPEETSSQMRNSASSSRSQSSAVSQRQKLLQNGATGFSLNGVAWNGAASGGAAGEESSPWSRVGVFANIQREGGEYDKTGLESGYDYSGVVLTLGADYALRRDLFVGGAFGWTHTGVDYANQGGELDTDIYTFLGYASYFVGDFSFDVQMGYGATRFDSKRRIAYTDPTGDVDVTAVGDTSGDQFLFNTRAEWQWSRNALTLSPYVRLDYLNSNIDGYGENGAGGLNMTLSEQRIDQLTLAAGVQGTYAISRDWGVLIPSFQLSALSEIHSDRDAVTGRFSYDPDPNNRFDLQADSEESLFYQAGVGTTAVLPHGLSVFLEYQQIFGYEHLTAYQVQTGVRYEL
ncbi:autotransporter domain-containing protein [Hahella sp. NBU794]|uniref:autotransporter domain-containing protein n=1 Tax=Hahella sp. NBU794 TaxID=3422590 RepID=UPI003D6DDFCC